jgi:hypothetical protein
MNNLHFDFGEENTVTVPPIGTDKGQILWALLRFGGMTVEELQELTDIRGISPRVHDLNVPTAIVMSIPEPKRRKNGKKTVEIVRYKVNSHLVDESLPIWQDFLRAGDDKYL